MFDSYVKTHSADCYTHTKNDNITDSSRCFRPFVFFLNVLLPKFKFEKKEAVPPIEIVTC